MDARTVILREATDDDLRPLHALYIQAWAAKGDTYDLDFDHFRHANASGSRTVVLLDGPDLLATLTATKVATDRGVAFVVTTHMARPDRPDAVNLLDHVSIYALNIGISEGCVIVITRVKPSATTHYGPDIGMTTETRGTNVKTGEPAELYRTGDAKRMLEVLIKRNPEWELSL